MTNQRKHRWIPLAEELPPDTTELVLIKTVLGNVGMYPADKVRLGKLSFRYWCSLSALDYLDAPAEDAGQAGNDLYDWMPEAREIAGQCWCDAETEHLELNAALAEAFARRIATRMQNESYWSERCKELTAACARASLAAAGKDHPYGLWHQENLIRVND